VEEVDPAVGQASGAAGDDPSPSGRRGFAATAREIWAEERVEVVAAILLSLATVLSAWGAYQATRWSGEQANNYALSAALRAESGRHGTIASRQVQIDVQSFIAWSDATAQHHDTLAQFYVERFRAEFKQPFADWRNQPTTDASGLPPGTPFDQPSYKLAQQATADELFAKADAALLDAQRDNQISDDFVLTAVLFASVLFFAGIAARFRPQWIRWTMLGVALTVFSIGLVVEFILPQNVGI